MYCLTQGRTRPGELIDGNNNTFSFSFLARRSSSLKLLFALLCFHLIRVAFVPLRNITVAKEEVSTQFQCDALRLKPAQRPGFTFPEEGEPGNDKITVKWARRAGIFSNESDAPIPLECSLYEPFNNDRIVYFLHIHKAGGSSLCSAARANSVLSHFAYNCIPGSTAQIKRCCGETLTQQADFAAKTHYGFVANEWPLYDVLDTEHYRYVVSLRDSRRRYVSHHEYDCKIKSTPPPQFTEWLSSQPDNFITRMLCGTRCLKRPKYQLTEDDLAHSIFQLKQFDNIIFLEDFNHSYTRFASAVGWKMWPGRKNAHAPVGTSSNPTSPKLMHISPWMHALDDYLYDVGQTLENSRQLGKTTRSSADHSEVIRGPHQESLSNYFGNADKTMHFPCGEAQCDFRDGPWEKHLSRLLRINE